MLFIVMKRFQSVPIVIFSIYSLVSSSIFWLDNDAMLTFKRRQLTFFLSLFKLYYYCFIGIYRIFFYIWTKFHAVKKPIIKKFKLPRWKRSLIALQPTLTILTRSCVIWWNVSLYSLAVIKVKKGTFWVHCRISFCSPLPYCIWK